MKKIVFVLSVFTLLGCDTEEERYGVEFSPIEMDVGFEIEATDSTTYSFTILGEDPSEREQPENILTIKEAAHIGSDFIWEVFGECIDGKYLQLEYISPLFSTRSYWKGWVAESETALNNFQSRFNFSIDAISGERIDIIDFSVELPLESVLLDGITDPQDLEVPSVPTVSELEIYQDIAKFHAKRHFNNTSVTNIELHPEMSFNPLMGLLHFIVTDETGREAEISIQVETQRVYFIFTKHNDTNPNLNVAPGIG